MGSLTANPIPKVATSWKNYLDTFCSDNDDAGSLCDYKVKIQLPFANMALSSMEINVILVTTAFVCVTD